MKTWGRTHPATSLTTSLTKAVLLLRWPFVLETLGLTTRAVVFYITETYIVSVHRLPLNFPHPREEEQRSSTR